MIVETFLLLKIHKTLILIFKGIDYLQINQPLTTTIYHHTILTIEIAATILLTQLITFNSRQHGSIRARELNNTHLINFLSLGMII